MHCFTVVAGNWESPSVYSLSCTHWSWLHFAVLDNDSKCSGVIHQNARSIIIIAYQAVTEYFNESLDSMFRFFPFEWIHLIIHRQLISKAKIVSLKATDVNVRKLRDCVMIEYGVARQNRFTHNINITSLDTPRTNRKISLETVYIPKTDGCQRHLTHGSPRRTRQTKEPRFNLHQGFEYGSVGYLKFELFKLCLFEE